MQSIKLVFEFQLEFGTVLNWVYWGKTRYLDHIDFNVLIIGGEGKECA